MSKYIKLKSILTILLICIVILQGLWINDAFKERKSHLKIHIQSSILHGINYYCSNNDSIKIISKHNFINHLSKELKSLDEDIRFDIELTNSKVGYINNPDILFYKLNCKNNLNKQYLAFIPYSTNVYIFQSILNWVLLSLIFIVLLSIFTGLYFKDINSNKHLQALKDEFIGNMTHELKTPISTISVASEILQNSRVYDNPEKIKQYSQIIYEENNRLKRLVDRVMQVGLFEEGRLLIHKDKHNINEIIEDACKPLNLVIEKRKGRITIEYLTNISELYIDANHIRNVISNIIENAIKYSVNEPIITISTSNNNNKFIIKIKDKGVGISKKDQLHIFDKYYRSESNENSKKSGFGIGLYYVYQVIKEHGANIKVESEIGKGSTFILCFNI